MSRRPTYTIACLARHGIGPEVMGAASRGIEAASRVHGFFVHEVHVPFGADALMRFGHPFPLGSRRAVLAADAVLVASERSEALEALDDELDLRASVARICFDSAGEVSVFSPLHEAWDWTLSQAFSLARESRARITLVGVDRRWTDAVATAAAEHDGIEVERLDAAEALRALVLGPRRFDVLVCPPELAGAATELAACLARRRTVAWGRLADSGPGIFGASHGPSEELAGHGVADPSSMLLAAALMLGEGLGERSAAATLSAAVGRAGESREQGLQAVADVVVAQVPLTLSNSEFYREAV